METYQQHTLWLEKQALSILYGAPPELELCIWKDRLQPFKKGVSYYVTNEHLLDCFAECLDDPQRWELAVRYLFGRAKAFKKSRHHFIHSFRDWERNRHPVLIFLDHMWKKNLQSERKEAADAHNLAIVSNSNHEGIR